MIPIAGCADPHGVSLSVGPQEVVCLVGRNGAGKTTTIDSIMDFSRPAPAPVEVRGAGHYGRCRRRKRARRASVYAPEDCGIFPDLTLPRI